MALLFVREAFGGALLGLITGYIAYRGLHAVDDYLVEVTMTLPARGHRPERGVKGESRRSDETTELRITSRLTGTALQPLYTRQRRSVRFETTAFGLP